MTTNTKTTTVESREIRYEIRDVNGQHVATHVRKETPEGKGFVWVRPDGSVGLGGLRVADLPLFGSEKLATGVDRAVVTEGEKAAVAAQQMFDAFYQGQRKVAALGTVTGASSSPSPEALAPLLRIPEVVLWPDADEPGQRHMVAIALNLRSLGHKQIYWVSWKGAAKGMDAADFLAQCQSSDEIKAKVERELEIREWMPDKNELGIEEHSRLLAEFWEIARHMGCQVDDEPDVSVPGSKNWRDQLIETKNGEPKACLANIATVLRHTPELRGIAWNEFAGCVAILKPTPWQQTPRLEWTETDDLALAEFLQKQGFHCSVETAAQAVHLVAKERPFHPVREYLENLVWDGNDWLAEAADRIAKEPGDYAREVFCRWCISAVARIFEPGCKADHVLVLEGRQGAGKSSTLAVLGGEWFTDQIPCLENDREASNSLRGVWIAELSELASLSRATIEKGKSFLSRSVDYFRPPYGRRSIRWPRQCVFAATTNKSEYLVDEGEHRRFWPLTTRDRIDVGWFRENRDQIWAHAYTLYREGVKYWIDASDGELYEMLVQEQRAREVVDPALESVERYVEHRSEVTINDILVDVFNLKLTEATQLERNRVTRCLRYLGWERKRVRRGGRLQWVYRKPGNSGDTGNTGNILGTPFDD